MLKDKSNGDEGWDARLGEALVWFKRDGECDRPLLDDMVRLSGPGAIGLESSEGAGDGDVTAEEDTDTPAAAFA